MSVAGFIDAPLDIFGGLVTDMPAGDLPLGVSPDCQDVAFMAGSVRTRPGLQSVFTAISGNPTVNYVKTFITPAQLELMLALDSSGVLWQESESTPGTLSQVVSGLPANAYAKSATLFGREYMAISDGKFGVSMPRQYDATNFDRVSQVGPGASATVVDAAVEPTLVIVTSPTGAVRSNNVATITTTTPHGYQVGQTVLVAGSVLDASFGGTFLIASVPSTTTFTYANPGANMTGGGDGTSTGGNVTLEPQCSPGVHQLAVIFQTRQGYITAPSAPVNWTTAGGRRASVTNIPIGPPNVTARILAFTGANGASFFYVASNVSQSTAMLIADNTTTSLTVDFSDAALLASTNVDELFAQVTLGECAGVIDYSSRLFWWGERSRVDNFVNLTFDGAFDPTGVTPLGWTRDSTYGLGGAEEPTQVVWGFAYRFTGPGTGQPTRRGMITQSAYRDVDGVPILAPATNYSVRLQAAKNSLLGGATLTVDLYSASLGQIASAQIANTSLATAYQQFTLSFSAPTPATIPPDLVLRVYADYEDVPGTSEYIYVDDIEIFATAQPYNVSQIRASGVENPENYDALTGVLSVAEENGQAVRAAFRLRESLYFVKEHSLYVTQDDGVNTPDKWTISEVSVAVGTPSVHGVDVGEDWAVIAGREGLYLFGGSEPVKISQEIQPTWDQINWQYGQTLWVSVDTRNKRILCGVPLGSATQPNTILMMDYRGLASGSQITEATPVDFSTITKKLFVYGAARKWCPWIIAANCGALIERSNGTARTFLGNAAGNGKIYQLGDTQYSDDGAAIDSYYTTAYFLPSEMEASLNLRSHRKLFGYLTAYVEGAGNLALSAFADSPGFPQTLVPLGLSNPGAKDLELPVNVIAERVAWQLGTGAVGAWFRMQRIVPSLANDPWAPVRGGN
jgi:hypothetical protein